MSGYKKTPNAKPIINITIPEDLLQQVVDYKFDQRIDNRSQAICKLVRLGLEKAKENNSKSSG
jgi:metal-responsive CopG/Arc/MetJ family transcriptional regulator